MCASNYPLPPVVKTNPSHAPPMGPPPPSSSSSPYLLLFINSSCIPFPYLLPFPPLPPVLVVRTLFQGVPFLPSSPAILSRLTRDCPLGWPRPVYVLAILSATHSVHRSLAGGCAPLTHSYFFYSLSSPLLPVTPCPLLTSYRPSPVLSAMALSWTAAGLAPDLVSTPPLPPSLTIIPPRRGATIVPRLPHWRCQPTSLMPPPLSQLRPIPACPRLMSLAVCHALFPCLRLRPGCLHPVPTLPRLMVLTVSYACHT